MADQEQPKQSNQVEILFQPGQPGPVVDDFEATQEEIDNALTLKEVCARTGLSMVYVRRRISTGKWHAFKDDKGRNRILEREVVEWEGWRKTADERKVARAAAASAKAAAKEAKAAAVEAAVEDPAGIAAEL